MPHLRVRPLVQRYADHTKQRFAEEYLLDCDPQAAAERAGLRPSDGHVLLARPDVQTKIKWLRVRRQSHTEIYADAVLRRWWQLATADARELSHVRRVNCRHCHGIDHQYQFTVDELRRSCQAHEIQMLKLAPQQRVPHDDLGGDGFNPWGEADPDCTECGGAGVPQVWVEDSRNYSPAAALLFDGVRMNTRDGTVEIKHRDRGWADQQVAAHLGIAVRGNRDGPAPVDPARMSDEQLEAAIEAFERAGVLEEAQSVDE